MSSPVNVENPGTRQPRKGDAARFPFAAFVFQTSLPFLLAIVIWKYLQWLIPKLLATNYSGDELGRDAFQVDTVFTHGNVTRQMIFMHAAKGA